LNVGCGDLWRSRTAGVSNITHVVRWRPPDVMLCLPSVGRQ